MINNGITKPTIRHSRLWWRHTQHTFGLHLSPEVFIHSMNLLSFLLFLVREIVKKNGYFTVRLTIRVDPPPSLEKGWSLQMIICNHKKVMKNAFWDPSQWDKMCFEYQKIKFQWEKNGSKFSHFLKMCFEYQRIKFQWKIWVKIFTFTYSKGRGGWSPSLRSAWP